MHLSELKEENLILSQPGYETRQNILDACHEAGFEPQGKYEIERLETACSLVEAGLGMSIIPESYLKYSHTSGINIVRLKHPTPKRTVYIAFQPDRYLPPAIHYFMDLIIDFFK
ncbi:LysR substrate binding domain-containing protein [Scopulibacillus darangshiensis]|uniref:LysR substrate binding domain-containing protein n=2 Tax=Scopulibacillus darangshiensis TaxID=442528 RepID=A0A4R2P638_9BACL|nr:LysR substrate binding domain-containing protein [Scopulibacillus darangshiensis]